VGDKLFLNTQKSGSKINVPLPKTAVEALNAIENGGSFLFWSGKGLRKSAVADWQRAIRRLFELADVTGHPHMFRHTFATDLLSKGIPIADVSAPLGHPASSCIASARCACGRHSSRDARNCNSRVYDAFFQERHQWRTNPPSESQSR
jgi:integrase